MLLCFRVQYCTCDIIASCSCMWCQGWRRHKCSSALHYFGCYRLNFISNTTPRHSVNEMAGIISNFMPSQFELCSRVSWTSNGWVTPKLSWVTGTWKTRSILLRDGKMEQCVTALNVLRTGSWFPSRGCLLLNNRYHRKSTGVFNL